MSDNLQWQLQNQRLTLRGVLDCTTLPSLWRQRQPLLTGTRLILDVAQLSRIDSAGLALLIQLIHLATQQQIVCQLAGTTNGLMSLIEVYNLLPVIAPYFESSE